MPQEVKKHFLVEVCALGVPAIFNVLLLQKGKIIIKTYKWGDSGAWGSRAWVCLINCYLSLWNLLLSMALVMAFVINPIPHGALIVETDSWYISGATEWKGTGRCCACHFLKLEGTSVAQTSITKIYTSLHTEQVSSLVLLLFTRSFSCFFYFANYYRKPHHEKIG